MRIGIDVGGTKIEGIALNPLGEVLFRERISTPAGDYAGTVKAVSGLVDRIERDTGETGSVGIGIPGTISSRTGLVKNANSTCLIGQPFDRDISDALGREVRVANDADCFAISEATDGAATGYRSVFGAILGTGVGGGLVVDGSLLAGPNGIAGEWGHNPLPGLEEASAPVCNCGRRGCIETFLSGPGLSNDHYRHTGEKMDAHHIAVAGKSGDTGAAASQERYTGRLARALAGVINIFDPDAIVLGGGLSNIPGLTETVRLRLAPHVFSDSLETALLTPEHGDSSGVRGAAYLWPPETGRGP